MQTYEFSTKTQTTDMTYVRRNLSVFIFDCFESRRRKTIIIENIELFISQVTSYG
jgi:hypothetical protein